MSLPVPSEKCKGKDRIFHETQPFSPDSTKATAPPPERAAGPCIELGYVFKPFVLVYLLWAYVTVIVNYGLILRVTEIKLLCNFRIQKEVFLQKLRHDFSPFHIALATPFSVLQNQNEEFLYKYCYFNYSTFLIKINGRY